MVLAMEAGGIRGRVRGLVAAAAVALSALIGTAGPANAAASPLLTYVALGDSVPSGHGLGTSAFNSDGTRSCQRSAGDSAAHDAYTDLVRSFLEAGSSRYGTLPAAGAYFKLACSGATTGNVLGQQVPEANAIIGSRRAVITITAGADDFRFTNFIVDGLALDPKTYPAFADLRSFLLSRVEHDLLASLEALGRGQPARHIVVTGYFSPVNHESILFHAADRLLAHSGTDCEHTFGQRPPCDQVMTVTISMLNQAIATAVTAYGSTAGNASVDLVDGVAAAFAGHEGPRYYCGTAPPDFADSWVQALPTGQLDLLHVPNHGNDCVHPNPAGHQAIAKLVEARL